MAKRRRNKGPSEGNVIVFMLAAFALMALFAGTPQDIRALNRYTY